MWLSFLPHPTMPLPLLLVEDDAVLSDGLLRTLQAQDMQVELLHDGLAADARLQNPQSAAQLAVVVLDIGLPGIDGYEVARRIKKNPALAHIRLVAHTGYGSPEDRRRAMEAGFDAHLVKPAELPDLEKALKG